MKSNTPAQKFRLESEECQLNAEKSENPADREAWLQLANHWARLAQAAQLRPLLERMRIDPE